MATEPTERNIVFSTGSVTRCDREHLLGQLGTAIWLTGLSGSGKSTIARSAEARLHRDGRLVYVLDGDNVRHGLNRDLGFSDTDRQENIRRIGEVASLFVDAGIVVLAAFISPFRADRDRVRTIVPTGRFIEVFVDSPLETCEARDPKGLYRRARRGEVADFTGISSAYEPPEHPDIVLPAATRTVDQCVEMLIVELAARGVLASPTRPVGR